MKNKILRICINLFLIIIFLIIAGTIISTLLAEIKFDSAEYETAIKIDPFDSRYPAAFGGALVRGGFSQAPPIRKSWLEKAGKMYEGALALNPSCAEYILGCGEAELGLFLESKDSKYKISAMENFKKAFNDDPNGFNVAYRIGYAGLSLWNFLDEKDRKFILERLKYCLEVEPSYGKYIYPKLWRFTEMQPSNVSNVITAAEWRGVSDDGRNMFKNGAMCWNGTIYGAILAPKGHAKISIKAKGSPADGVYPYMIVELDGSKIGEGFVASADWRDYYFDINTNGGIKMLSVTFTNDGADLLEGEDRNLYIDEAHII